ncbi:hypothetical protein [Actinopolymorpha pittospori]|uniref:Uncharacterized protein n=1 Tax=Actinopolymorpha pittospori TaxID=648752 RepID=A0A927RM43_9ACTN|nr:hypothetical protein [Actinopolymorpha pittospori]MBE1609826.1 hypothetical protein [Actinopolymorpha pittospori]
MIVKSDAGPRRLTKRLGRVSDLLLGCASPMSAFFVEWRVVAGVEA